MLRWRREEMAAEHATFLRDAEVVILPDNDDVGRAHMNIVAASLQGIAASIRVLDLPGLPPKGDIVDWAAAGGTREALDELLGKRGLAATDLGDHETAAKGTAEAEDRRARAARCSCPNAAGHRVRPGAQEGRTRAWRAASCDRCRA